MADTKLLSNEQKQRLIKLCQNCDPLWDGFFELDPNFFFDQYDDELHELYLQTKPHLGTKIFMFENIDFNQYDENSEKLARIIIIPEPLLLQYLHKTDFGYFTLSGKSVLSIMGDDQCVYRRIYGMNSSLFENLGRPDEVDQFKKGQSQSLEFNTDTDVELLLYIKSGLLTQ